MVKYRQLDSGACAFALCPNCALGWGGLKCLFLFFAVCLGAVVGWFAYQGAWLVLPFAGLELAVLGAGVYLNARWSATREVVVIENHDVRLFRGRSTLREMACIPRYWSRISLVSDPKGHFPSRLQLQCHGRSLTIGGFLVEAERVQLAADLHSLLSFTTSGITRAELSSGRLDPVHNPVLSEG